MIYGIRGRDGIGSLCWEMGTQVNDSMGSGHSRRVHVALYAPLAPSLLYFILPHRMRCWGKTEHMGGFFVAFV